MGKRAPTTIQRLVVSSPFDTAVQLALVVISENEATRLAYRGDFDLWLTFCREASMDHAEPPDEAVVTWVEWMKRKGHAPKSRARRISSLSSLYRELRRKKHVRSNPFSVDEGPARGKTPVVNPTKLITHDMMQRAVALCDSEPIGLRDAAIMRVLWATGMRRVSLLSMTFERLQKYRNGYIATVIGKGGDDHPVFIRGRAKDALDGWLEVMRAGELKTGAIWRMKSGDPMTAREVNRVFERRGRAIDEKISPHMLRVAFITYNPAPLDAKQDAAGHADPATTMLYDRATWRGLEAFERMPEIEDVNA